MRSQRLCYLTCVPSSSFDTHLFIHHFFFASLHMCILLSAFLVFILKIGPAKVPPCHGGGLHDYVITSGGHCTHPRPALQRRAGMIVPRGVFVCILH